MPTVSIVVRGSVQGVGFRAFVEWTAGSMGVRGEVWNARDGGVGIVAQHDDPSVLKEFEDVMSKGPGRVGEVSVRPFPDPPEFTGFKISFTR